LAKWIIIAKRYFIRLFECVRVRLKCDMKIITLNFCNILSTQFNETLIRVARSARRKRISQ